MTLTANDLSVADDLTVQESAIVAILAALAIKAGTDLMGHPEYAPLFAEVVPYSSTAWDLGILAERKLQPVAGVMWPGAAGVELGDSDVKLNGTWSIVVHQESRRIQDDARVGNAAANKPGIYRLLLEVIAALHLSNLGQPGVNMGLRLSSVELAFADSRRVAYTLNFLCPTRFKVPP